MGLESLETNLDADRAERRSLSPSSEEDVVGHIPNRRFDPGPVRDVLVERPFDADRLRIGPLLDGQFLDPASDGPQPDRILAHELLQLGAGEPGQFSNRPDPDSFEHRRGFRTDPADTGDEHRVQKGVDLLWSEDIEADQSNQIHVSLNLRLLGSNAERHIKTLTRP